MTFSTGFETILHVDLARGYLKAAPERLAGAFMFAIGGAGYAGTALLDDATDTLELFLDGYSCRLTVPQAWSPSKLEGPFGGCEAAGDIDLDREPDGKSQPPEPR